MSGAGDALDGERLTAALAGGGWVRGIVVRSRVDSTNDELRRLAAEGAPDGTVLLADEQSRGRGRRGRSWHSPAGLGLYCSVLFRETGPAELLMRWTLGAAVAAAEACRRTTGIEVGIEWPNDLVADRRKLGGVLAESRTIGTAVVELVLGVGINVAHGERDFPADCATRATSLRRILGADPPPRTALAAAYLEILGEVAAGLRQGAWRAIAERWERRAVGATGQVVRVVSPGSAHSAGRRGCTCGLAPSGALRVRAEGGFLLDVGLADSVVPEED